MPKGKRKQTRVRREDQVVILEQEEGEEVIEEGDNVGGAAAGLGSGGEVGGSKSALEASDLENGVEAISLGCEGEGGNGIQDQGVGEENRERGASDEHQDLGAGEENREQGAGEGNREQGAGEGKYSVSIIGNCGRKAGVDKSTGEVDSVRRGAPGGSGRGGNDRSVVGGHRSYLKVVASFKCSNESCRKRWSSAHGWKSDEWVSCEYCNKKAFLKNLKDEDKIEMDIFVCSGHGCGNRWYALHAEDDAEQECEWCETMVHRSGVQERAGRHFWYECRNTKCEVKPKWEQCSTEPQRGQRCSKCGNCGVIYRLLRQLRPRLLNRRIAKNGADKGAQGGGGGDGEQRKSKHNAEFCDMCQDLRKQRVAKFCHGFREVVCQLIPDENGRFVEKIVKAKP